MRLSSATDYRLNPDCRPQRHLRQKEDEKMVKQGVLAAHNKATSPESRVYHAHTTYIQACQQTSPAQRLRPFRLLATEHGKK